MNNFLKKYSWMNLRFACFEEDGGDSGGAAGGESPAIINADGTFAEGWTSNLDEGIRDAEILGRMKDIKGMAQSLVHQEKLIGSYKNEIGKDKIIKPDASSGKEAWDALYKAAGWPDRPDEYELTRPEDFPEDQWDDNQAKVWMQRFHELHLNKEQVKGISELFHGDILDAITKGQEAQEKHAAEVKGKILEEAGNAYEAWVHIGNVGTAKALEGQPEEYKQEVLDLINEHPALIKFTYLLGSKFVESPGAPNIKVAQDTPAEINQKIAKLREHPAYLNDMHAEHKNIMDQLTKLYQKKGEMSKTA